MALSALRLACMRTFVISRWRGIFQDDYWMARVDWVRFRVYDRGCICEMQRGSKRVGGKASAVDVVSGRGQHTGQARYIFLWV
jgi:hypothetical protein